MRKRLSVLFMLLISVLIVTGCRDKQEEASLDISFEDYEFGDVDRICLGHELEKAYIDNEAAIALFKELISELQGSNGISSQGYADGGYSISMMARGKVFSGSGYLTKALSSGISTIRTIQTGMSMRMPPKAQRLMKG